MFKRFKFPIYWVGDTERQLVLKWIQKLPKGQYLLVFAWYYVWYSSWLISLIYVLKGCYQNIQNDDYIKWWLTKSDPHSKCQNTSLWLFLPTWALLLSIDGQFLSHVTQFCQCHQYILCSNELNLTKGYEPDKWYA